ncbi:MAG: hypothetical protein H0T79_19830, partial [Deltaproteobacteria bacterium]|nr:hypothetical protein [Deltaproteobacteria bacterium]
GVDGDACNEGIVVCDGGGGTMCSDATASTTELCNGVDDDCRNGIDDSFPLGQGCTVGLGQCARSGMLMCNGAQTGTQCSVTAGAAVAETCGNVVDEDCNGIDPSCPTNDRAAGAIDISSGGNFTVDLVAAHDDNWAASSPALDCGDQGGRDVFYQFTLPAEEVVYFDTFGSTFDSVVRVFDGACTAIGATRACGDDACAQTRSQGAVDLAAGTYCLVVDQFDGNVTSGTTTLAFRRGGRAGTVLPSTSGSVSGTTTGKTNLSTASCEANTTPPDLAYAFLSCPSITYTVGANTCTGSSFDTVLSMRTGSALSSDIVCNDDFSGCGTFNSKFTGKAVTGASLQWFIVDGYTLGTGGHGSFTLTYTIQ